MAAVTICSDLGAEKIKSDTVSTVSPSISHEVVGPDAMNDDIVGPVSQIELLKAGAQG